MNRKIVVLCLLVSICAFGSVSTVDSAKVESLSKEEIIKAFSGKTVEGYHNMKQFNFVRFYGEDGTLIAIAEAKVKRVGKWKVTDDGRLCEFKEVTKNKKCKRLERIGDLIEKYDKSNINVVTYRKFVDGNQL
jgi:hypothetical protein